MTDDTPAVNRTPTSGLFVKLDTEWVDHPKIIRAGIDGAGLHATALCIAKRLNTDGWIDRLLLVRYGATDELIGRLVDLRLLEGEGDQVRPWGWLDRNPSQGAIDAMRASKSDAAKRGNHRRWEHPGRYESCPKCHKIPTSSQGAIGVRSHSDRVRSPESESESETETESVPTYTSTTTEVVEAAPSATVDEQAIRRTAALIGRALASTDLAGIGNLDGYAAAVTKRILTDPLRRDDLTRIRTSLEAGATPEQIAASWQATAGQPVVTPAEAEAIQERARLLEQDTRALLEAHTAIDPDPDACLAAIRTIRTARKAQPA